MGRWPPPSDPPDRPDGRYTYVEKSEPPEGLRRRERAETKRGLGPILSSLPPRSDPPEVKVKKALIGKAIGKAIEWAVGAACVASMGWLSTRASKDEVKDVRAECAAEASARVAVVKALTDRLEAEEKARLDAGQAVGESLNKQDAINRHVWEIMRGKRETAPPPVGPKGQAEGRQ
jgi:hypothetical protein